MSAAHLLEARIRHWASPHPTHRGRLGIRVAGMACGAHEPPLAGENAVLTVAGYDHRDVSETDAAAEPELVVRARTSLAASIVTSVVDQLLDAEPTLCPTAIKHLLIATADRVQGPSAIRRGYGVLNASRALAEARRDPQAHCRAEGRSPRIERSHLVFCFRDDGAKTVQLFGDFSGHMQVVGELARGADGLFVARIPTPLPGRYRYKFIVDGVRWTEDPAHGLKADDGFGGFNSLVHVGWDLR